MADLTTVILTKNEEKNIEACITSVKTLAARIVVIDCGSDDKTVSLAEGMGAEVYYHPWTTHADQFNWGLDHCEIKTTWVLRLDADERVSDALVEEIEHELANPLAKQYNGFEMRWQVYFMGRWIRYGGTHKPYFLRLFRNGCGRVEEKLMDEHIKVEGNVKQLSSDLIHYDYKGLDTWLDKHIWYSNLELGLYCGEYAATPQKQGKQQQKRSLYYKLPLFLRARLYYWYRYYIQLGFLDGKEGKIYIYLQSYWYRFLVDAKLYESLKGRAS